MRKTTASAAVATTVGAFAIASALLAPAANARDTHHHTVWDKVAHCESDNSWHIATGNGFFGGLQFTNSTWHAYGGGKYAARADHATRIEQIEVARRVLHSQGRDAWPVCGPRAGLTRSDGHATGSRVAIASPPPGQQHTVKQHSVTHHAKKHATHHAKRRAHAQHTYTVRSGDTLRRIARTHHISGGWRALYRANRSHLANPNVLHVGQHLRLP